MSSDNTDPQTVYPFRVISRGFDTVDENDDVVFADFSPRIVDANQPDESEDFEEVPAPKEPAPEPASSQVPTSPTGTDDLPFPESPVESPAPSVAPPAKPSVTGSPTSSSPKKSG